MFAAFSESTFLKFSFLFLFISAPIVTLISCGAGGSANADLATCTRTEVLAGGNCGCELQSPVDLTQLEPTNGIWPFGVHGGGHPEGHPGWDFQSGGSSSGGTQLEIVAPAAGHVYRLETDTTEDPEGVDVFIKLDCGIQIVLIPMRPDASIVVGSQLVKGQRIGVMSLINGAEWMVHFGAVTSDPDPKKTIVCPTPFFPSSVVTQLDSIVANATFQERNARNVNFSCVDSSTLNINLPAEPNLCADHLATNLADQIETCIQPENIQVW
jgi:hypothetical protein